MSPVRTTDCPLEEAGFEPLVPLGWIPERLDEEELADWRAGRNAIYQLAALTIDARLAVADG
jgi:hypothetical protein